MNALKQMIPNIAKNPEEAQMFKQILDMAQQAEKYTITGVSELGLCMVQISPSMNVKGIRIDRQKFAEMQNGLRKEQNPNELACSILEEEMFEAIQDAMNQITQNAEQMMELMPKQKKHEDIGEFMG